jgi:hypothetical protein
MLTRSETPQSPFRVRGYAARAKSPLLTEKVRAGPVVGTRNPLVRIGHPERNILVFVQRADPLSRSRDMAGDLGK